MQETRVLPKGTMVKIGGIPFVLGADAPLTTHEGNWEIAFEERKSSNEASKKVTP